MAAGTPIIKFHQIGKMGALPAAVSPSALAAQEKTVEVTGLENRFLRMVRGPLSLSEETHESRGSTDHRDQPAAGLRGGGRCRHHAAARIFLGIGPDQRKDTGIVIEMRIIVIHDLQY